MVEMQFNGLHRVRPGRQLLPVKVAGLFVLWPSLLSMLLATLLSVLVSATGDSSPIPDRKADLLFKSSTPLHGRVVTCDNNSDAEYKFPAETWSCYNMRIDGMRLRSYYTRELKTKSHCTDDNTGKNDLAALCRELLAAHQIKGELWAALIVKNPHCSESDGERMMFFKANKSYEWVKYQSGKGFVHTLRCMLMK